MGQHTLTDFGRVVPVQSVDLTGWQRRTTIDEPRLTEIVELYEELGFDVLVQAFDREALGDECIDCYLGQPERFRTVYTRARGAEDPSDKGEL